MSRGIKLLLQVKQSVIDTGFELSSDRHVDLAYAIVEAGIYGTMGRKAWLFALTSGGVADATIPMYRKISKLDPQRGELIRYVPKVSVKDIRGSYAGLLFALEAIADASSDRAPQPVERNRHGIEAAAEPQGEASDASGNASDTDTARGLGRQSESAELVRLPDGSHAEIEWEQITAEEFKAGVGVVYVEPAELEAGELIASNREPGNGGV